MGKKSLFYISKEPKSIDENTPLLIMLHGYGSNEEDLFSFAGELSDELLIVSARATQNLGYNSYAWYTIHFNNTQGKFSDIPEAMHARDTLAVFIDEIQKKYGVSAENTFLLGFSQGTILSYAVALNYPEKVRNIVALSGYINAELMPDKMESMDYASLDFFISHGTVDQVIPAAWAIKAPAFLDRLNISNCYREYPVGHGVAPQNFYDLKKWVEDRF